MMKAFAGTNIKTYSHEGREQRGSYPSFQIYAVYRYYVGTGFIVPIPKFYVGEADPRISADTNNPGGIYDHEWTDQNSWTPEGLKGRLLYTNHKLISSEI